MKTQILLLTDTEIAQVVGGVLTIAIAQRGNPLLTTLDHLFGVKLGAAIDRVIVAFDGGGRRATGTTVTAY